jgi:hypothetical protein
MYSVSMKINGYNVVKHHACLIAEDPDISQNIFIKSRKVYTVDHEIDIGDNKCGVIVNRDVECFLQVPADLTVDYIFIKMGGDGQLTITKAAGVQIHQTNNYFKLNGKNAIATLLQDGQNEYTLIGDLKA